MTSSFLPRCDAAWARCLRRAFPLLVLLVFHSACWGGWSQKADNHESGDLVEGVRGRTNDAPRYELRLVSFRGESKPQMGEAVGEKKNSEGRSVAQQREAFLSAIEKHPRFSAKGSETKKSDSGIAKDELAIEVALRYLDPEDGRRPALIVWSGMQAPSSLPTAQKETHPGRIEATVALEAELASFVKARSQDHLDNAFRRVLDILVARLDLRMRRAEPLLSILEHEDPRLIQLALEWISEHPGEFAEPPITLPARGSSKESEKSNPVLESEIVDTVVRQLKHQDEGVVLAAIEALAEIGGPEHVSDLLNEVSLANEAHAIRTFETLASLGGPEAKQFLLFAVRNEEESRRRVAAQLALEGLVSRQDSELSARVGDKRERFSFSPQSIESPLLRGHRR